MGFFSERNNDWMERHDKSWPSPEHLHNICEVERTIALAKEELLAKWGVKYPLLHRCPENGTLMVA